MRNAILLLFVLLASALPAGMPASSHWTQADLQGWNAKLAAKMKDTATASQELGRWGSYFSSISRRNADGEAELHEKENDWFVVQAGEATLITGGKIVNPRTTGPGQVRGASIQGGERVTLKPGDVVHIAAGTPHQMLVKKELLYFVIKVVQ